jgi:hypothetical protein
MKRIGIALLLLAANASAADLVRLDANEGPVENGKTLKMEFREIERKGDESIVRIMFHSGGSVSSSMFVLKGVCAIAKSRGAKFFRNVKQERAGSEWGYTIAFANTPNAASLKIPNPPKPASEDEAFANGVFSFSECQMLGFGL